MPAAILLIIVSVGLIPDELAKFQGKGHQWKLLMATVIIIDVVLSWRYSMANYNMKNFQVGRNGDAFWAYAPDIDPRGLAVTQLLNHLATAVPPRATVAILPEGAMINYLSRHANSVPFILVNPFETEVFGEKTILDSFKHSPPHYIVLVHPDSRGHGTDSSGLSSSCGKETLEWINSRYEPVWHILTEPLKDGRFGIKMLKQKSPGEAGEK